MFDAGMVELAKNFEKFQKVAGTLSIELLEAKKQRDLTDCEKNFIEAFIDFNLGLIIGLRKQKQN